MRNAPFTMALFLLLFTLGALGTTAYGSERCKSMIVGNWQNVERAVRYRYDSDGSHTTWDDRSGKTYYGSFSVGVSGDSTRCFLTLRFQNGVICQASMYRIGRRVQIIAFAGFCTRVLEPLN